MDENELKPPKQLQSDLAAIDAKVRAISADCKGDAVALLALLRTLEHLHREICDGQFQDALPNNRQALYSFLRDMESQGGWPHIPRFKLQLLLSKLQEEE
jgi:hypothetical protein